MKLPPTKAKPWLGARWGDSPKALATDAAAPKRARPPGSRPVRPNIGLQAAYRRRILALVDEMGASVDYWLTASYRANEPHTKLAADELPAAALLRAVKDLAKRWQKRFNAAAPKLADWFAQSAQDRSDAVLRKILKDGGISVRFKQTAAQRDAMAATVAEQVGLIRSIPQQYLTQVDGMVMRSAATGRDLGTLAKDLREQFGVTKRRAALIARDQNNKATATMTRVRQVEVGIKTAKWLHSHGGKVPRRTHLRNDGKVYDVAKGWYDPDPRVRRFVFPGELINCRCVSAPIVKGFS